MRRRLSRAVSIGMGKESGTTSTIDWDGDGIANPYDWTPTSITVDGRPVEVNLTAAFTGAGGSAGNPWPIYNVWQLQAIDGMSVSRSGAMSAELDAFRRERERSFGGGIIVWRRISTRRRRNNGTAIADSIPSAISEAGALDLSLSQDFLTAAVMRCGGFLSIGLRRISDCLLE